MQPYNYMYTALLDAVLHPGGGLCLGAGHCDWRERDGGGTRARVGWVHSLLDLGQLFGKRTLLVAYYDKDSLSPCRTPCTPLVLGKYQR